MKNLLILVPTTCAILAMTVGGYCFHVAVPVLCAVLIVFGSQGSIAATKWLLVAALAFSIAGDWMLRQRNGQEMMFVYGIAGFFVAHAGFLLFCLRNGRMQWRLLLVLATGYGVFFFWKLLPAIDGGILPVAVLAYTLISCFSLAAAWGLHRTKLSRLLFSAGIGCILFSDTLIACCEFLNVCGLYRYAMMPAYYAAHLLITAALIYKRNGKTEE
ncbi:MAG: lysoplasmalogenase [Tannerella sp.]|nr:lysoplasmalogenase [Tannerella sp.]